jgi:hypothetical protein
MVGITIIIILAIRFSIPFVTTGDAPTTLIGVPTMLPVGKLGSMKNVENTTLAENGSRRSNISTLVKMTIAGEADGSTEAKLGGNSDRKESLTHCK